MSEWQISNKDIVAVEEILLPHGAHFPDDARNVICRWNSANVSACPGSGKTTVLLAKLKLLADRMPFENGAGICVLSHTNVAVDEVKKKLSGYTDKLMGYPNFIGTIQSFVDSFVTMPYLRNIAGQNIQVVDSLTYAQYMLNRIMNNQKYKALDYVTKNNYETGHQFTSRIKYIQALYIRDDGALCIGRQKRALASTGTKSAEQYKKLCNDLLTNEGMIRYQDAYSYAKAAIENLPAAYTNLFSSRFQYVFIDEYQDCDDVQRQVIDLLFDPSKCAVFKIGDPDQAIYNSSEDTIPDWVPEAGFLSIMTSCRFNQEIANVICKLKNESRNILSSVGESGTKPVLFVFSPDKIDRVIDGFISELESHGLYDTNGVYKAIGAIRKEDSVGLKIGSYWNEFDGSVKKNSEYNYWLLIAELTEYLSNGKLYKAEQVVRKLLCRVFRHLKIKSPLSGNDYTVVVMKKALDDNYRELYRQWIFEMSRMQSVDRDSIDNVLRQKVNELLSAKNPEISDVFTNLPDYFLDKSVTSNQTASSEKNVMIEPTRNRRIVFDTIHAVKGETHDATLYLETDRQGASDLNRILPYFGVGKKGSSNLYDYSRKLAYVGMSRPRKLLCVAMQSKTYEKSKGVFSNDWEVVDLR
ncbi:MAG: UvrD-helicase domain-containing protein [Ruminococcus sp.]|nr:UvrD-helicase domain-containing protein [Ruminococcus sp.]